MNIDVILEAEQWNWCSTCCFKSSILVPLVWMCEKGSSCITVCHVIFWNCHWGERGKVSEPLTFYHQYTFTWPFQLIIYFLPVYKDTQTHTNSSSLQLYFSSGFLLLSLFSPALLMRSELHCSYWRQMLGLNWTHVVLFCFVLSQTLN